MDFIRNNQLNAMLVLSSICIMILIFLLMTNYLSKEKKKSLLIFVFFTAFLLLSDRGANIYRNQNYPIAYILAPLFKYLVFFNVLNVVYGFGEFIKCLYNENHHDNKLNKLFTIVNIILIIGHILLLVSQFTNIYYSFDSNNIYHREKYYFVCYLFPIVATILQYIVMFKQFKNIKKYIFIPLVLYFTLPIVASVIQLYYPGLSLVNIIIGGVVIILYSVTIYDANIMQEEKKKTEADLNLARDIQQNEIPNEFPAFPNRTDFDLYASMTPAKEVGGDFYDYFLIDDNHLGIAIADVSGKGVPAALNMFKAKILLKSIGIQLNNPAEVLNVLNNAFIDNNKLDMFVTIWFGILEISTGKLIFSNAGHEDIIICDSKGFNTYKTKHGLPIGTMEDYIYQNNEVVLKKGDKLFVYTDGVTDSINDRDKSYGVNNLLKVLNENRDKEVNEIVSSVKNDLEKYTEDCNQFDDVTMLCLELTNNKNNLSKQFKADIKEISNVYEFVSSSISNLVGVEKVKKYYVVIDEVFSNIVKYGFKDNSEDNYIEVKLDIDTKNKKIKITFIDNGIKFNPLENEDPNISLSSKQRKEGGLGIYIVKKMMDKASYEYKNNKNIFIIEKKY